MNEKMKQIIEMVYHELPEDWRSLVAKPDSQKIKELWEKDFLVWRHAKSNELLDYQVDEIWHRHHIANLVNSAFRNNNFGVVMALAGIGRTSASWRDRGFLYVKKAREILG